MMVPAHALPAIGTAFLILNKIYAANNRKNISLLSLDNVVNMIALSNIAAHFFLGEENHFWKPISNVLRPFSTVLIITIACRIIYRHSQYQKKQDEYEKERDKWVLLHTGRKSEY